MPHPKEYYEKFVIYAGENWDVNLFVDNFYYLGRVVLWYRHDQPTNFFDLPTGQMSEFVTLVRKVELAVTTLFQPNLFNWSLLQNITNHCHAHGIPRYQAPREYAGITFVDANWGHNPSPYDKDFDVADDIKVKLRDDIAAVMQ